MGKYVYYRCTEYKGRCKNSISESQLAKKLADVVRRIHIPEDVADGLRIALQESHEDKIMFHEDSIRALERHAKEVRRRLDRAYEDKLDGAITDGYWRQKTSQWNGELLQIESDLTSHRNANTQYLQLGTQVIDLARSAYGLYCRQNDEERRELLNFVVSKMTYVDGTLYPIYRKPFDLFVKGSETKIWRGGPHSPQTSVEFTFDVRTAYSMIGGTRWKTIS